MLDFASPNMMVTERGQLDAVRMGFILVEVLATSVRAGFSPLF